MNTPHAADWGDLRAWLAGQGGFDGQALHNMFLGWADESELHEAVIPYCIEQMKRQDLSVHPQKSMPYTTWFDQMLDVAFYHDQANEIEEALAAYETCLRIKPDCFPAQANLCRLRRRGKSFTQVLAQEDWVAHGPYGQESWERVEGNLTGFEGADAREFQSILAELEGDIEHQWTLYPSTLVTVLSLIHFLDQDPVDNGRVPLAIHWLASVLLLTMFGPYHTESMSENKASWPVDKLPSFTDPHFVHYSASNYSKVDSMQLQFEQRKHLVWHEVSPDGSNEWAGYNEWEECQLPYFSTKSFYIGTRNVVYDAIDNSIFQSIASGLPVYRRLAQQTPGGRWTDHLLWHLGHFARQEQNAIQATFSESERQQLSHITIWDWY